MANNANSAPTSRHWLCSMILMLALTAAGCTAGLQQSADNDPLEPINRKIYAFNNTADTYVFRPVAKGYNYVVPQPVRTGVSNFFDNATYPVTIVNGFLQGEFRQGGADTLRLLLNSTVGIFGLTDPATAVGLAEHKEDFGLTFAKWGAPQGPFVMLPILGPYTARSAIGIAANVQVNPILQMQNSSWRSKLAIAWFVETRAGLIGPDELVQDAFDPYAFLRDAYLQNRAFLRQENSTEDALFDDGEFFEDADFGAGDDF